MASIRQEIGRFYGFVESEIGGVSSTPYVTGDVTLSSADLGRRYVSTDATPVNYFLPPDMEEGDIDIFQGGAGQISFVAINGATIVDGILRSEGRYTEGYWARIHSFGDGTFCVIGDVVEGLLTWSVLGNTYVNEGDSASYVIWRPDSTNGVEEGVTLTVSGTGFDTAGLDQTLEEALTALTLLEPGVTFDGVDQLTILPEARNPLPLHFYATPSYTNVGDRQVVLTISNPSIGEISSASVTTDIYNTSKPLDPATICDADPVILSAEAASGQALLTVQDASDVEVYSTIVHANIPALAYVTSVVGNVITLSANLTGTIAAATSLARKRPGFYFDFTDTSKITKDGSNVVSAVVDSINGYSLAQGTAGLRPTYVSGQLNGYGCINFAGSGKYLSCASNPVAKLLDAAGTKYTCLVVGRVSSSYTTTGFWLGGPININANSSSGIFNEGMGTGSSTSNDVRTPDYLNIPFLMLDQSDGYSNVIRINNQRNFIPVTLTADAASGQANIVVDDVSSLYSGLIGFCPESSGFSSTNPNDVGIQTANENRISSINTGTNTITMNANLAQTIPAGTTVYFFSHIVTNAPINPAKTTSVFTVGADTAGSNSLKADIFAIVIVPWCMSAVQCRALHKFFETKFSTNTTTTANGSVSAGAYKITLASTSGIHRYQLVSGTNIKTGSTISKINTTTKEIWLDEPVQTGGVANGATLTFHDCAVKMPDILDITDFIPTFRDDFTTGVTLANSGDGWKPYYGDITSPGTYPSAYGSTGHGSSNNGNAEREWYLDVLNYSPWQAYNPFSLLRDDDMPTGGLKITAEPADPDIANLIGYTPPQPTLYTHTSGYIRDAGGFSQQYGYWEGRMRTEEVPGVWAAIWLTAAYGSWPAEIDIAEVYGDSIGRVWQNVFRNQTFANASSTARSVSMLGDIFGDNEVEYMLFGVEIDANLITFYMNREKVYSCGMSWSTQIPWLLQLNMAVETSQSPDSITPMSLFCDYVAAWRRPDPTVTLTGSTQAETTALVAAMTSTPSAPRQALINAFIEECKLTATDLGDNLWDDCDIIIFPAAHNAQAGRINWKDPSQIGSVVGSPTFVTDRGYSGTLNTNYIDMGFVLSAKSGYGLNNALNQYHIGAVCNNISATNSVAIGTTNFKLTPQSGGSVLTQLWSTTSKSVATASTNGHYVATRNHFRYDFSYNGELPERVGSAGSDTKTTDTDNLKIANGTSQVAMVHAGKYLTPDDRRRFYAIIYTYLHALGAL